MSFQERERVRLALWAAEQWKEGGQWTEANRHILPHVLVKETLQADIRDTALDYFDRHGIKWWRSKLDAPPTRPGADEPKAAVVVDSLADGEGRKRELPTGHLNSSQVACVNHLEPARLDYEVACQVLRNIDARLVEAYPVEDGGYVAYEWIGDKDYLGEPGARVRGANVTSLDALMLAGRADGKRVLVPFEWKYLERYGRESVAVSAGGIDRKARYEPLLTKAESPIKSESIDSLFYEPYCQLMRQTLLAWRMVVCNDHKFAADDWLHVHVVPEGNSALRKPRGGGVHPSGTTMEEKWKSALKQPERYRLTTPERLLAGIGATGRWQAWRTWCRRRYLT